MSFIIFSMYVNFDFVARQVGPRDCCQLYCTKNINEIILPPHTDTLKRIFKLLWKFNAGLDDQIIPAKDFLSSSKNRAFDVRSYSGPISVTERAEIAKCIHHHISDNYRVWFEKITQAHAIILY